MAEVEIFRVFLLVLVRITGLLLTAPVLGSANFPMMAKVGFAAMTAMLVTSVLPSLETPAPSEALAFGLWAAGEFLIGLLIGFVMTLAFAAIQVAGQIMDLQTGFGMMNIFNPAFETQFPVFGFFLFILAVLYLLAIDGHHMMLRALVSTYDSIPPGGFAAHPELMLEMSRWGRAMFIDGLMIAAPIAAAMLMAYATMGLLGRVVPQIHLLVVGFPFTMGLAMLITGLMIGLYLQYMDGMFHRMFRQVETLIAGMG